MPLLQVNDLRTYFGHGPNPVKAVDGVSFHIDPGETFCIVGESGSGKSVTALSVIQLIPQQVGHHPSGEIWLESPKLEGEEKRVNMLTLREPAKRNIRGSRIAMIFQEPMTSLNPVMTIGEQITESLYLHMQLNRTDARERAIELLEQVKMPDPVRRLAEYPHRLSGGQRQRAMIAMAMACEPDLLIADEPTTALDVTIQAQILDLMAELQRTRGTAMLFITHDIGVVAQIADRVAVMNNGVIVEAGTRDEVLMRPQHPYTHELLAALPSNLKRLRDQARADADAKTKEEKAAREDAKREAEAEAVSAKDWAGGVKMSFTVESNEPDHAQPKPSAPSVPAAAPLISVNDLRVYFPIHKGVLKAHVGDVKAVDGVDLIIPKGHVLALVGESGCGKTTLGRALLGLLPITGGSINYKHVDLARLKPRQMRAYRSDLQIVFQDPYSSLNPRLTIATTLTEPMAVHGKGNSHEERLELARDVLRKVKLEPEMLNRFPHEFSGGQRQRIGIARALALEPKFVVCDEVTSALDVSVQAQVLKLLTELRDAFDLTYLFITHNIEVVRYLADSVAVMRDGQIVERGPTDHVCDNPQHPYTQELLAAVPRFEPPVVVA